jgi:hypothetical protein
MELSILLFFQLEKNIHIYYRSEEICIKYMNPPQDFSLKINQLRNIIYLIRFPCNFFRYYRKALEFIASLLLKLYWIK